MVYALISRFRRKPVQNTLLLSILLFHFIFLISILFLSPDSFRKKERKHLIVRTVVEQPKPKTTAVQKAVAHAPATPKKAPEVKKQIATPAPPPAPAKKPAAVKEPAIADKKIAPAKQVPPPKAAPAPQPRAKISDSLLKELEESIAKIENKSDKPSINKKASSAAPISLQIDSMTDDADDAQSSYTDTLIGHLHASLSLPDYGEVKIQLSLRQDGTVVKVVVLKAKNEKNRQYLESNLPRLKFPRFDGAWANKKEHSFVLTFCNEQ